MVRRLFVVSMTLCCCNKTLDLGSRSALNVIVSQVQRRINTF